MTKQYSKTGKDALSISLVALAVIFSLGTAQKSEAAVPADLVNQAIQAKHAQWKAKENWVSKLSQDQIKRMLGVTEMKSTDAEFIAPRRKSLLNETVDWRNQSGMNFVSPILNQGNCGSCVSFATVATLETQVNITAGIPGLNPAFSTQALFACGGGACEFGWMPQLAAKFLQTNGVPDEACAPYTMGSTGETVACSSICKDADSRTTKVVSYSHPSTGTQDIDGVKAALKHGPLITTLMVYQDFLTYSSGVYQHVTGGALGGHAVSIVGFDDTTRSWIIRNSWGSEWGEGGFAHISWDDTSGISNNTWGLTVPDQQGYVTIQNPHGRVFLAGKTNFQVESTFAQTEKVDVQIVRPSDSGASDAVKTISCTESKCSLGLDTATLKDGYYQAVATASYNGGKQSRSEFEQFYVFNGAAKLSLTSSPKGVDLSKPLTDRIEFNLASSTGTEVPLSSIIFHVQDEKGQEAFSRSTDMVLSNLTMGWRTNAVPDGRYQIWFTGRLTLPTGESVVETPKIWVTTKNSSLQR